MELQSRLEIIGMLTKMIELLTKDEIKDLEPYAIALHSKVCHCREYSK